MHSINRRLDSLEHTVREISSQIDRVLSQLQTCEDRLALLEGERGQSDG